MGTPCRECHSSPANHGLLLPRHLGPKIVEILLDCSNKLYLGLSLELTWKLQQIQHAAGRFLQYLECSTGIQQVTEPDLVVPSPKEDLLQIFFPHEVLEIQNRWNALSVVAPALWNTIILEILTTPVLLESHEQMKSVLCQHLIWPLFWFVSFYGCL